MIVGKKSTRYLVSARSYRVRLARKGSTKSFSVHLTFVSYFGQKKDKNVSAIVAAVAELPKFEVASQ